MIKNHNDDDFYDPDREIKSFHLLKHDHELFHEKDNVINPIINIKRILLNKKEDWQILENNIIKMNIKGVRFVKAERKFLRSIEGMKFLIAEYKSGIKSVVKIKQKLKKILENK